MNDFYDKRKKAFEILYFQNSNKDNIYCPNGFTSLPHKTYSMFLKYILKPGKIIDMGCGNGMLLRYIYEHSQYEIIPYGVDFQKESIRQAKSIILPQFKENFFQENIINFSFNKNYFDYILCDPYHLCPSDIANALKQMLSLLKTNGKLIVYSYQDSMEQLGYKKLVDFQNFNLNLCNEEKGEDIFIGYFQK